MEITEVRVKLVERSSERLQAFCSITLDGDFVIRDLKIIDGANGPFVAMPSRKLADRCGRCGSKNHLRAKYCNECGLKLNENRAPKDPQGRAKLHADVAHPINAGCRERIQKAVVEAFRAELEKAKSPDYKPVKYDDFDVDVDENGVQAAEPAAETPAANAAPAAVAPEPQGQQPAFEDYDSLIADLKRDAADRRQRQERHDRGQGRREPAPERPHRPEPRAKPDEPAPVVREPVESAARAKGNFAPPAPARPQAPPPPPAPAKAGEGDDFSAGL